MQVWLHRGLRPELAGNAEDFPVKIYFVMLAV
jgi:hypothetical protein